MKILLSTAIIFCGFLTAFNSAFAQTWTPTGAPISKWSSISASADGSKLAALSQSGAVSAIWVSTNSGIDWTSNNVPGVPDSGRLEPVAWSATGDKLAAVALFASAIFTSTNYGATWISNGVPVEPWFRIASSADGTRLVALGGGLIGTAPIYISADSGLTWAQAHAPITNWVSVASSANGSNWVAAVELQPNGPQDPRGYIYTSTNCGLDWALMPGAPNLQWSDVASSADGTKLLATGLGPYGVTANLYIYTSTNSGVTWISNTVPNEFWNRVACSADGRTLAAVAFADLFGNSGFIYTSTNSGTTWISNSVPGQNWFGIASSSDGGILVAAGSESLGSSPGGIYISQAIPAPELNIAPANTNLTLSWIIPSTNFVLQQSSDLISWVTLTNTLTLNLNNLQEQAMLSATNSIGFFRLITQ